MGHQGRIRGIPPRILPLPSHLSQSGHFTTGSGGVEESSGTETSDLSSADSDKWIISIFCVRVVILATFLKAGGVENEDTVATHVKDIKNANVYERMPLFMVVYSIDRIGRCLFRL